MKQKIFDQLNLSQFDLTSADFSELDRRTVVVTRWNWDYATALEFQRACVRLVQEIPELRVLICCSHPQVLTHGRGLQRARKGQSLQLQDFDPTLYPDLPYPLFQIERGGGLTFHHPGQFIFYPIVKLNPTALSLSRMIDDIFAKTAQVLNDWGLSGLDYQRELLGLWHSERKLASMGIAIQRLTTFHGMALNLQRDHLMFEAMKSLNPCGISADTYAAVEDLISLPLQPHEAFCSQFLKRIGNGWQ
jgi:lipoyl(octanoyl) transferase